VDLIVEHHTDRISRALEIKWIAENNFQPSAVLMELQNKIYPMTPYYNRTNFVVSSETKKLKKNHDQILTLQDLV
jgi:hypothetical protein